MSDPQTPSPDHAAHVPDAVLDELMAAFSKDDKPAYDFDDPHIDDLLGLDSPRRGRKPADVRHERGVPESRPNHDDDDHDNGHDDDDDDDDFDDFDDVDEHDEQNEAELDGGSAPADTTPAQGAVDVTAVDPPLVAHSEPRRTIVIADDGRPDAEYLDEEKEERFHATHSLADASGERTTIVISDMDEGRVVESPPTRSGGNIDPRLKARRIAIRRAEGRRRLVWAGIAVGVVLLAVAAIAVVASSIFDVRTVTVQGAVYTDKAVLDQVIASLKGKPVLLVDTQKAERTLNAVPWVESAHVETFFPHRVVIDVRERVPVATFRGGDGRYRVIDAAGRVLDVIDNRPLASMLITGTHPDTARGDFAGGPYAVAGQLVVALPSEIRQITQSVGVDAASGTLSMVLQGGVQVRLGDGTALDLKLARLLQQVRQGLKGVTALDVSTSEVGRVGG